MSHVTCMNKQIRWSRTLHYTTALCSTLQQGVYVTLITWSRWRLDQLLPDSLFVSTEMKSIQIFWGGFHWQSQLESCWVVCILGRWGNKNFKRVPRCTAVNLQHTAAHYNTLQQTTGAWAQLRITHLKYTPHSTATTLRHAATHRNTLQQTTGPCITIKKHATQIPAPPRHCNTLLHAATHCNTL